VAKRYSGVTVQQVLANETIMFFPLIMTITLHRCEATFHNTPKFNMAQAYFYVKGHFSLFAIHDASRGKQTAFKSTMPPKNLYSHVPKEYATHFHRLLGILSILQNVKQKRLTNFSKNCDFCVSH